MFTIKWKIINGRKLIRFLHTTMSPLKVECYCNTFTATHALHCLWLLLQKNYAAEMNLGLGKLRHLLSDSLKMWPSKRKVMTSGVDGAELLKNVHLVLHHTSYVMSIAASTLCHNSND